MPPLYARRSSSVPDILVPLTPELRKHYWELFASLRELAILRCDNAAAMKYAQHMDYLLDYPVG